MVVSTSPASGGRHPHFPPLVPLKVFLDVVRAVAANVDDPDAAFQDLSDDNRTKARRALQALALVDGAGRIDELTIRRLADDDQRPVALRALLERHYAPELRAIRDGIDNKALGDLLRTPPRSSGSAAEKAGQFLKRAIAESDLELPPIRRSPARRPRPRSEATPVPPGSGKAGATDTHDNPSRIGAALCERFLVQLLDRHAQHVRDGTVDRDLEDRVERLLHSLDGWHHSGRPPPPGVGRARESDGSGTATGGA